MDSVDTMLDFAERVQLPVMSQADYVHDMVFDFYGRRMALCTSSLRIAVYTAPSEDSKDAEWIETANIDRAHTGPIWRLAWGAPEFGEPLVSCSEDRCVKVWADRGTETTKARVGQPVDPKHDRKNNAMVQKCVLQCDGPVVDVRIAPAALGLRMATVTSDGKARVFTCDSLLTLSEWQPEDLEPKKTGAAVPSSAGNMQRLQDEKHLPDENTGTIDSACPALDWRSVPFQSGQDPCLAVCGRTNRLSVWISSPNAKSFTEAGFVEAPCLGGIKDLAWCPNLCRAYELVATCGDGAILWKVEFAPSSGNQSAKATITSLQELQQPGQGLVTWRCTWNERGTALSLLPEGCKASVWRYTTKNEWEEDVELELSP